MCDIELRKSAPSPNTASSFSGRALILIFRLHAFVAGYARNVADKVPNTGAFFRIERKGPHDIHRCDTDTGSHQSIDDTFTEFRRKARCQSVADELLNDAITHREGPSHGQMRHDPTCKFEKPQGARTPTVKL